MAELGIFDGERVELLDGIVLQLPPLGIEHWSRHGQIVKYVIQSLGPLAQVHGRIPLPLRDRDEPNPI